jgi:hypothetical protein
VEPAVLEQVLALGELTTMPVEPTVQALLIRAGRRDEAARRHVERPIVISPDSWLAVWVNCVAAEVAAELGDAALGAAAYRWLAPYPGRAAAAAASLALGPVDSYLMLAAVATGELAAAVRHADDAAVLCQAWGAPLAAQRLAEWRERFGC